MLANFKNMDILTLARYYLTTATCGLIVCSVTFLNSYNIFFALIVSSYFFFISPTIRQTICLGRIEKSLIIIMSLYIATFILEVLLFGEKPRLLDKPAKVLLLMPLIPLLSAVKLNSCYFVRAFIIGSVLLLVRAGYDTYILSYDRAGSDINPIQFSAIAIGIASAALALLITLRHTKPLTPTILLCLATGGFWAGILSESRGSIIAIPIIISMVSLLYIPKLKAHKIKAATFTFTLLALAAIVLHNPIKNQFQQVFNNIIAFNDGSNTNSSTGIRLGQWKLSLEAGLRSPILGIGYSAFNQHKDQQVLAGRYGKELLDYDNSHNTYANAFARRGLIGLFTVILFLGFPIYLGIKAWRQKPKEVAPYALAIASFGCVFFIANITQEVIFLNTGIIMYTGLLVILTSMLAERIKACESDPPE